MTCIVAIAQNGQVVMGGDSAAISGAGVRIRKDPKVFERGGYLIGYSTSFRMGDILRCMGQLPDPFPLHTCGDPSGWMVENFIPAVKRTFRANGFGSEVEGGSFLVGVYGRVYEVETDFQVGEAVDNYAATGDGRDVALGSLYATQYLGLNAVRRVEMALDASAYHSVHVRPPYTLITHGKPKYIYSPERAAEVGLARIPGVVETRPAIIPPPMSPCEVES